jgi:hypothetical protein
LFASRLSEVIIRACFSIIFLQYVLRHKLNLYRESKTEKNEKDKKDTKADCVLKIFFEDNCMPSACHLKWKWYGNSKCCSIFFFFSLKNKWFDYLLFTIYYIFLISGNKLFWNCSWIERVNRIFECPHLYYVGFLRDLLFPAIINKTASCKKRKSPSVAKIIK